MTGAGFFITDRRVFEHPFFEGDEYSRREAWMWLIGNAAWEDGPKLKRGQLAISLRAMAATWGWKKRSVERFLAGLKAEKMVVQGGTQTGTPKGTPPSVLTICNYDKHQTRKAQTGTPKGTQTGTLVKEVNHLTKDKKENIRRVEADHDARFEEFWTAFPKRDGDNPKAKARAKFLAIAKAGTDPTTLIEAARHCAAQMRKLQTEPRFVPMAITWLNQQRWNDYRPDPADQPLTNEQREQMFAQLRALP